MSAEFRNITRDKTEETSRCGVQTARAMWSRKNAKHVTSIYFPPVHTRARTTTQRHQHQPSHGTHVQEPTRNDTSNCFPTAHLCKDHHNKTEKRSFRATPNNKLHVICRDKVLRQTFLPSNKGAARSKLRTFSATRHLYERTRLKK